MRSSHGPFADAKTAGPISGQRFGTRSSKIISSGMKSFPSLATNHPSPSGSGRPEVFSSLKMRAKILSVPPARKPFSSASARLFPSISCANPEISTDMGTPTPSFFSRGISPDSCDMCPNSDANIENDPPHFFRLSRKVSHFSGCAPKLSSMWPFTSEPPGLYHCAEAIWFGTNENAPGQALPQTRHRNQYRIRRQSPR